MEKLQETIEEILLKHSINPSSDAFYLELRMPSHENFTVGKVGEQIIVKINDSMLAFDYNEGHGFPVSFENKLGNTICSFIENGKRMIIPYRMKRFLLFQGMLIRNIKGLLENGVKVE